MHVNNKAMCESVKAQYKENGHFHVADFIVDNIPDFCPLCQRAISPDYKYGWFESNNRLLNIVFQCPHRNCSSLFFSYYEEKIRGSNLFFFKGSAPWKTKERDFHEVIKKMSPNFCKIYNEANGVEESGLKEICGPGYRKAFEFLIKDYLVNKKTEVLEVIQKKRLMQCIDDFIDDQNIKSCAKRAAWLGNDETHYYRIWGDKDLSDLKTLIDLTLHWIEKEALTKKFDEEMPEDKSKGK